MILSLIVGSCSDDDQIRQKRFSCCTMICGVWVIQWFDYFSFCWLLWFLIQMSIFHFVYIWFDVVLCGCVMWVLPKLCELSASQTLTSKSDSWHHVERIFFTIPSIYRPMAVNNIVLTNIVISWIEPSRWFLHQIWFFCNVLPHNATSWRCFHCFQIMSYFQM